LALSLALSQTTDRVDIDVSLSPNLTTLLSTSMGSNTTGIKAFADGEPIPLRWAEVVPLYFMKEWVNKTQVAIMSIPLRRYDQSVEMIPGESL